MASPQKPWERTGVNSQNSNSGLTTSMSSLPPDMSRTVPGLPSSTPGSGAPSNLPPPLPARPSQQMSSYGGGTMGGMGYGSSFGTGYNTGLGMGGYGSSMYSPYNSGMYGSSMYGGGMYGSGYGMMNRYGTGMQDNQPNSFVRTAEESTRGAFQSIESIVQAFGSVSMMLESTYSAVFNSFRAVLGVADQFGRMRQHFAQIFSAFALFRTLHWLYRKFLILLRLRPNDSADEVWSSVINGAASGAEAAAGGAASRPSSWPILFFFAVIVSGPWLIWKFLCNMAPASDERKWSTGETEHFVGQAEFDFQGQGEDELSFTKGQKITIAPKEMQPQMRGWLMASVDGTKTGIIPANYIKVLGRSEGQQRPLQAAGADGRAMQPIATGTPTAGSRAQTAVDMAGSNPAYSASALGLPTHRASSFPDLPTSNITNPSNPSKPGHSGLSSKAMEDEFAATHQIVSTQSKTVQDSKFTDAILEESCKSDSNPEEIS